MSGRIFTSERSGQSIFSANDDRFANCPIGSPLALDSRGRPLARPAYCVRHRYGRPSVQKRQIPHQAVMQPITGSPGAKPATPAK